ncbi:MAG: AraC family transcriptional regulator, partial [Oscillospiraceae bacterium]|nr:AraC family transcriptional regulator [Oscillospiraceae bacterium]
RILDFIKDHYRENITLQSIARDAHVSYYYLSRSFREVTGFSFREHLRQVRAQKSLAALQDTKDSILNIALASGFPTVKSYTSAFQARYGVSPTQYRRNARRSGIASVDTPASFAFNGGNNPAYTPANSADDLNLIYAKFNTAAAYSVLAGPGPALSDNSYMNRGG